MNREEFCRFHWSYYLFLEKDFLDTERYISFDLGDNYIYDDQKIGDVANSQAFSTEFIKQFQTICAEIDVVLKTICKELGNDKANCMPDYTKEVLKKWNDISKQRVRMKAIELQPFRNWRLSPEYNAPDWWPSYNDVKHNRISNFKQANLKNVVNALAGLYILELYLVKMIGERDQTEDVPNDISRLFEMVNFKTTYKVVGPDQYLITEGEVEEMFGDPNV